MLEDDPKHHKLIMEQQQINEDAEEAEEAADRRQISDYYLKTMIPWHIDEARRDIKKRDFFAAEMNIAIAERMLNGTWFDEREFKRLLIEKMKKPLCEQGINYLYP
jgi:hypothetical protein